jgi:DNA-binding NarL/FixJ family response regulator
MTTTPAEPTDCQPPLILAVAGLAYSDGEAFELLERVMNEAGLRAVVLSVPATEAVDTARRRNPALIIVGHRPLQPGSSDVTGATVVKALKAHPQAQHIPVLLVEGLSDTEAVAQACGADAYLQLPEDAGEFVDVVRKLVGEVSPRRAHGLEERDDG